MSPLTYPTVPERIAVYYRAMAWVVSMLANRDRTFRS
jgi:hypothetical protein